MLLLTGEHVASPRQASLPKLSFSNVGLPASSSTLTYIYEFLPLPRSAEHTYSLTPLEDEKRLGFQSRPALPTHLKRFIKPRGV